MTAATMTTTAKRPSSTLTHVCKANDKCAGYHSVQGHDLKHVRGITTAHSETQSAIQNLQLFLQ